MPPTGLIIWVEGLDDQRFFDAVAKPILQQRYGWIAVRPYAQLEHSLVDKFLRSAIGGGIDYIFVSDCDTAPCVTSRKAALCRKFLSLDPSKVVIVVREIECWYLAGLDDNSRRAMKIPSVRNTDLLTKELFNSMMHKRYESRVVWMLEILNGFSRAVARDKNRSFRYFCDRYDI